MLNVLSLFSGIGAFEKALSNDGISLTIQEWAEKLNITLSTLRSRINKGWTIDRALTTPVRRLNRL